MQIKRYCGKERLPGGERLWRKLAKLAGFDGRIEVFGYGVGGIPGREQRSAYRRGDVAGFTQGDWACNPDVIRVWLRCSCQTVEFDPDLELAPGDAPLDVLAHELGHHRQHIEGALSDEAGATKRGAHLLNAARL